jgi:hypothetical protein
VGDHQALAEAIGATLDRPQAAAALRSAVAEYHQETSALAYLDALGVARPG